MRGSIERLRVGLLVGAALLVAVIAGFLGYAHYRAHRILKDLPGMLGATITKEFDGYTYSQSLKGKTVFTLHAAKAVERKDGTYTLHDVAMTMYGRSGDRDDHISGAQFEYDEKAGLVRAVGVVHLDLQAAEARTGAGAGLAAGGAARKTRAQRVIHVTTSGLVYTQKLGVAATPDAIEFESDGLRGHAVGAEYDSDTGHVVLQAAVSVEGVEQGKAVLLTAKHAELDRQAEVAELVAARYSSSGETAEADGATVHLRADGSAERVQGAGHVRLSRPDEGVVTAERMDVALDGANKPQRAVLDGMVRFEEDSPLREARAGGEEAVVRFDGAGRIEHVALRGGGGGGGGLAGGRPGVGSVSAVETVRGDSAARGVLSTRTLTAETVELALVPDAAGRAVLREATANGAAKLRVVGAASGTDARSGDRAGGRAGSRSGAVAGRDGRSGVVTRQLSGDHLTAEFVERHGTTEIASLDGVGETMVEQVDAAGVDELSRAPRLTVRFRETGAGGAVEVATAVQEGGVALARTTPPATGAAASPSVDHATARRALYDGDRDRLTLLDQVQVTDAGSVLTADRVDTEQASGDAVAIGDVKVTYLQSGGGAAPSSEQPVHVAAAWAEMKHGSGVATFYGMGVGAAAAGGDRELARAVGPKLARMWQPAATAAGGGAGGGSQVEAPVLVFESQQRPGRSGGTMSGGTATVGQSAMVRLTARGDGAGSAMAVRAVLVSVASVRTDGVGSGVGAGASAGAVRSGGTRSLKGPGKGSEKGSGTSSGGPRVIRVSSREMVYSDAERVAEFTGGVRVIEGDGVLRADEAKAFLAASEGASLAAGAAAHGSGMLGGSVERIVAVGGIDIRQPGRVATGEKLVYTAADQMFVLTGTAVVAAKVVSAEQGTATGFALRFHTGDDSVVIEGGAGAEKAHTETRVKK